MSNNNLSIIHEKRDALDARPKHSTLHNWIGVVPFFIFTALFIILPSVTLLVHAFQDNDGKLTLMNFIGLLDPSILNAYWISIRISLTTALVAGCLAS